MLMLTFAYALSVTALLALQNADEYGTQKISSRLVDSVMRLGSPLI